MYLQTIASAVPPNIYTQADCWNAIRLSPFSQRLKPRSMTLLEKVLLGDSGIDERRFCINDTAAIFTRDAESLSLEFEDQAPKLGGEALVKALNQLGEDAGKIDALFVCTCTGYLCPGISSHLAEQYGLRPDCYLQDLVGLGCGAAIPALRSADAFLAANPEATVAVVAVEICSAAFYMDDDPGVLISLCLFGDGASASIWRATPPSKGPAYKISGFRTVHKPADREKIRFVNAQGKLKNKLHRTVPELAAVAVRELYDASGHHGEPRILAHPGGRDVVEALEANLPTGKLVESREVLRKYGNLSSPSVMVVLEEHLKTGTPDNHLWLTSFGAGFACHSAEMVKQA